MKHKNWIGALAIVAILLGTGTPSQAGTELLDEEVPECLDVPIGEPPGESTCVPLIVPDPCQGSVCDRIDDCSDLGQEGAALQVCGDVIDPCTGVCQVLHDCVLSGTQEIKDICGIVPDACSQSNACEVVEGCMEDAAAYTSYGMQAGGASVCGIAPDPCAWIVQCDLYCVQQILAANSLSQSGGSSVCGTYLPDPCPDEAGDSDMCGYDLGPCEDADDKLCQLPCVDEIRSFVAASSMQSSGPDDVCGLDPDEICAVMNGNGVDHSFEGYGGGTTGNIIHMFAGLLQLHMDNDCAFQKCKNPNGPYQNGDCPCWTDVPVRYVDTDGDRSLDMDDVDDDCDKVVDDLEVQLSGAGPYDPMVPDDLMDMSPFSSAPVEIQVSVANLANVNDLDPGAGSTDPYASDFWICHTRSSCPIDKPVRLPGFNRENHPSNIGSSHSFTMDDDDWSETAIGVPTGSDRLDDVNTYGWRGANGQVTEVPRLGLYGYFKDDDKGFRGDDGNIGGGTLAGQSILEVASLVKGDFLGPSAARLPVHHADVDVQIGISASRCAMDIGMQSLQGATEIRSTSTYNGQAPGVSNC